jgi:hypothetical protein
MTDKKKGAGRITLGGRPYRVLADERPRPNVHVYYGASKAGGWNQQRLAKATEIVGHDCEWFDGLQADFYVKPTECIEVVGKLNEAGICAEFRAGMPCPPEYLPKRRQISKIKAPTKKLVDLTLRDGHMLGRKILDPDGAVYRAERDVGVMEFEVKYPPGGERENLKLFRLQWDERTRYDVFDPLPWEYANRAYVPAPILCLALVALATDAGIEGAETLPDAFADFFKHWHCPDGTHSFPPGLSKELTRIELDVRCDLPISTLRWMYQGPHDEVVRSAEMQVPTSLIADAFAGILAEKLEE